MGSLLLGLHRQLSGVRRGEFPSEGASLLGAQISGKVPATDKHACGTMQRLHGKEGCTSSENTLQGRHCEPSRCGRSTHEQSEDERRGGQGMSNEAIKMNKCTSRVQEISAYW